MPVVVPTRSFKHARRQQVENALATMFAEARDECRSDDMLLMLQLRRRLRQATEEVELLKIENRQLRKAAEGDRLAGASGDEGGGDSQSTSATSSPLDDDALAEQDLMRVEKSKMLAEEPCRGLLGFWVDKDNPGLVQEVAESKISSSTGEEFDVVELTNTKLCFLDFQKNVVKGELVGNLLVWNDGGVWCRDLFDKMDADRDGRISREEIEQAWTEMLAFVSSETGTVTADQFDLFCQVPAPGLFARIDVEGSGELTKEKFEAFFVALASDGGHITREDFANVQALAESCECGNFFKPDDAYCRWCGKEQLGNIRCDGTTEDGKTVCGTILTRFALDCPDCGKIFRGLMR